MAMQLGSEDDDLAEAHEINVTPFIDVMLVLLIIFMVAAPLATVDVPVNLPTAAATPQPRPDKPVYLTLSSDRNLHLGDAAVTREALPAALEAAFNGDREGRVFLRADGVNSYSEVMEVLNLLRNAGWTRVALVGLEQR